MNSPVTRPAFAEKLAPLNAEREPSLKEAAMELVLAELIERQNSDRQHKAMLAGRDDPYDDSDIRLNDQTCEARDRLYAAFAKLGLDKALVEKMAGAL